jgi:hypothetical protein
MPIYVGANDISSNIKSIYVGQNDIAKKIIKGYAGVSNISELVYSPKSEFEEEGTVFLLNSSGVLKSTHLTYHAAYSAAANYDIIQFGTGSYDLSINTYSEGTIIAGVFNTWKYNTILGIPGKTILNVRSDIANKNNRDNELFHGHNTTIRNIIFNYYMASGKSTNSMNSLFRWCFNMKIYNCVINTYGGNLVTMAYYNLRSGDNSTPNYLYNCTFNTHTAITTSYYDTTPANRMYEYNCVFKPSLPPDTNKSNCIAVSALNSDYSIATDNTTYGVYSGTYAWPS